MAARSSCMRQVLRSGRTRQATYRAIRSRRFSVSAHSQTDGVFRELTDQRVQTPWIEAFRQRQREGQEAVQAKGVPQTPKDRDLSPKKMSDSYHSVVWRAILMEHANSLTDTVEVDTSVGPRSMAPRHLPQLLRSHPPRYAVHGPRCVVWYYSLQAYGGRCHHGHSRF